jgi:multidrug resistance protein MdtO
MIMNTEPNINSVGLLGFLKEEFRNFPGRYNAMLRYLVSSVIVIIISMGFQVPQLSLSLLVVFFATQQNIVMTKIVFPLFILANTLAVGCAILILKFTIDYPMQRLMLASVALVILLYLIRSSKMGFLLFGVAITVAYAQSFVDLTSDAEMLVRSALWSWVAGCYATLVAHIVNTLLLPVEPIRQWKKEIERVLTVISDSLDTVAGGKRVTIVNLEEVQKSMLKLHSYLKFSCMRDSKFLSDKDKHLAETAIVERLYSAVCELHQLSTTSLLPTTVSHCQFLANECRTLLKSIHKNETYHLAMHKHKEISTLPNPLLELYSALQSFPLLVEKQGEPYNNELASEDGPDDTAPDNKNGNLISYDYVKYSLKTLLSVAICYVFYIGVQWPGIHTSMLTCIIVALPGLGASVQKSLLRIGGCLVGSAFALFSTVFILPYTDSIIGLLLMVMPVIALSGWIAAGSERSSYAGIQMLFAFSLAMFTSFGPTPELSAIRDRIIGILLGITVSMLIHTVCWPDNQEKSLRHALSEIFFYFSKKISPLLLGRNPQVSGWQLLDRAQTISEQVSLEPGRDDDSQTIQKYKLLLIKLRELQVAIYRLEIECALVKETLGRSEVIEIIDKAMSTLSLELKYFGTELFSSCDHGHLLKIKSHNVSFLYDYSNECLNPQEESLLFHAREVITTCRFIREISLKL